MQTRLNLRIPTRDGITLSANLFLPDTAAAHDRVPAVLNMDPYRKDDWQAGWDLSLGTYLTERGYAYCRLDVRGTGSSDGVAIDEYTDAETHDGHDAVEWLGAQDWCTGAIGMWGLSYGGFTSIQVAATRPPHLRAIVPIQATDDRYTDDVHYVGGCVTVSELSQYAVSMVGMNALPARPSFRAGAWLEEWRDRLDRTPIWLFEWLRQQHDGPYGRQGSLAPEYEAAIFLIGGWMDGYVDSALRMLERCVNAPRRALIGNWVHDVPDDAYPGPNLDWLHEFVRFFDYWLKGVDNGLMDEPALTYFQRDYARPRPACGSTPGACPWPGAWWRHRRTRSRRPATERPTGSPIGRRPARGRRCRGERAPRRTASRATCGSTTRSSPPTRARRWASRWTSWASRSRSSWSRRRCRSPRSSSGWPMWPQTGQPPRSPPGCST